MGRVIAVLVVLGLLVGGLIALALLLFGKKELKLGYSTLPLDSNLELRINDGAVSYISNGRICSYTVATDSLKHLALTADIDGYAVRDNRFVVFDEGILHIEGTNDIQLTGTILDVTIGKQHVAVLRRNTQGDDSVAIFDFKGNIVGEVLDFSGTKVTNYGFYSENGRELLWIISISVNQTTPVTTVKMFDYGNGGTTSYLSPFYDQGVVDIYFTEDSLFAIGTQDIIRYSLSGGREKYRIPIYPNKLADAVYADDGVTFLLTPTNPNDQNRVYYIRATETDEVVPVTRCVNLAEPVLGAYLQETGVRVVTANHMYIYGYSGRRLNEFELEHSPAYTKRLDDTSILCVAEDGVYRLYTE